VWPDYVTTPDEAEIALGQFPREWWEVYSDWKQGLAPSVTALPAEWREPTLEALKSLTDMSDCLDLVRSAYRVKRARAQAAEHLAAGECPKCGRVGRFIRMALSCPIHGFYAGC
jgi:hypothetical protein